MIRGERLIKLGDSWFSAKSIEVECFKIILWGRALDKLWGVAYLTGFNETSNT